MLLSVDEKMARKLRGNTVIVLVNDLEEAELRTVQLGGSWGLQPPLSVIQ